MNHKAIYALYPQVVRVDDGAGAFDAQGNQVSIDLTLLTLGLTLTNINTNVPKPTHQLLTS
jgi:hypothetical protein